jgi:hypothetical protein
MDLAHLQDVFAQGGIVRLPDFISQELAAELAERALGLANSHGIARDGYPKRGGRSLHDILDGMVIQEQFPELEAIYSRARDVAERIVRTPVILSPYARSGVNIRVYRQVESEDGWHYDSNPLSALLYLTSGGSPTQFQISDDTLLDIYPASGLLLLFNGRKLLHHVPKGDQLRITCPLNLYYPDDTYRPDEVDEVLFENKDRRTTDALRRESGPAK